MQNLFSEFELTLRFRDFLLIVIQLYIRAVKII